MACGVPVVAFDNPWGHWILRGRARTRLLAKRTVDGLADQLERMCRDQELRERLAGAGAAGHRGRARRLGHRARRRSTTTCATPKGGAADRREAGAGVLLVTPEPLGERMAGPGHPLPGAGAAPWRGPVAVGPVTVASLAGRDARRPGRRAGRRRRRRRPARRWSRGAGSVVVQGDVLGLHPWLADVDVPLVVDAYDPFHLEQLEQARGLGEARRRAVVRDCVRALDRQLGRADLVLCASARQRAMWIGHLAALGRVNPVTYDAVARPLRPASPSSRSASRRRRRPRRATGRGSRPRCPGIGPDDDVVVWGGGIYDWFDPETVIRAVGRLAADRPRLRLLFLGTRHPAQGGVGAPRPSRARGPWPTELGLLDRSSSSTTAGCPTTSGDRLAGRGRPSG